MVKLASIGIIALGIIHLFVLGADLPGEAPRWMGLYLWTFDHWAPLRTQDVDLALSNGVFWATVGSFAVPSILLGALLLWADGNGWPVPPAIGWALFGWTTLASLIMAPSGFPVAMAVALLLTVGLTKRGRA